MELVIFDLSRTVVEGSGLNAGAEYLGKGLVYKKLYAQYKEHLISEHELVTKTLACWKGFRIEDMEKLTISFNPGAQEIFAWLDMQAIKTAIVSNAPAPLVEFIAAKLKCKYAKATVCELDDDVFTGRVVRLMENKGAAVKELQAELKIKSGDCIAVGDSHADIEMFKQVAKGVAYKASEEVQKSAKFSINDFEELKKII